MKQWKHKFIGEFKSVWIKLYFEKYFLKRSNLKNDQCFTCFDKIGANQINCSYRI